MEAFLAEIFLETGELAFVAMGVFSRIGAALFIVPGLGERAVPVRVRLTAALTLTILLAPIISPLVPQSPETPEELFLMIAAEAAAGLVIGLGFRLLIFALQIAGTIAAQHMTISHMFGSGVAPEPEPTISTLLGMAGITLALMAGLHIHLVVALADLYQVLPFAALLPGADLAEWGVARVAETFSLGLSLALPFVVVAFAYNVMLGALSRAMPQVLVALVGVPLLVGLGMATLWLSIPEIFARWSEVMLEVFANPLWEAG